MRTVLSCLRRGMVDRPRRSLFVAAVTAIALAAGTSFTSAAWTDDEWVHSAVGVSSPGDCSTNAMFTSQAWARQLTGTILDTSLDSIAGVEGLTVVNDGSTATPTPTSAVPVPGTTDAFVTKIPVSALGNSAVSPGLGLGAPVGGVGTYTQWARSQNNGQAHGASGLVSDQSGAVDVAGTADGAATAPKSASITLGNIVPATLTGVTLDVGAVASSSSVEACVMVDGWPTLNSSPAAERDYGIAGLGLNAHVPAVEAVVTPVTQTLNGLPGQLESLETDLVAALKTGVGDVLDVLGLVTVDAEASLAGLDTTTIQNLLSQPQTEGAVTLSVNTGRLTVDLAKLPGNSLNNRVPNSPISLSASAISQVQGDVQMILSRVLMQLRAALDAVTVSAGVTAEVRAPLLGTLLGTTQITIGGTLGQFRTGSAPPPTIQAVGLSLAPLLGTLTNRLLGAVFDTIVAPTNTIVSDLQATLVPVIAAASTTVGPVLTTFSTLVAIHVNVQPDQPWPGTKPADVTAAVGEYKVSAIRVGLTDSAGLLSLSLGNSSAGPVSLRGP